MELRDIIQTGGLVGFLLVAVVFGGFKGWWYYGPQVDRQLDERDEQISTLRQSADEWKGLAMTLLQSNRQATENQAQIASAVRGSTESLKDQITQLVNQAIKDKDG